MMSHVGNTAPADWPVRLLYSRGIILSCGGFRGEHYAVLGLLSRA
jgi:hypothetical protein